MVVLMTCVFWKNTHYYFQKDSEALAVSMVTAGRYGFDISNNHFGLGKMEFKLTDEDINNLMNLHITDLNWDRGYSRKFTSFFVPSLAPILGYYFPFNKIVYAVGNFIELSYNDIREIIFIEEDDNGLYVFLDGEMFDFKNLGYPLTLRVSSENQ
jgi:hypothetical protein